MYPRKYFFANDEPQMMDIAWPHLSVVYQMLNGYRSIRPKDKRFENWAMISRLIQLLNAPDMNEREELVKFFNGYLLMFPDKQTKALLEMGFLLVEYPCAYACVL